MTGACHNALTHTHTFNMTLNAHLTATHHVSRVTVHHVVSEIGTDVCAVVKNHMVMKCTCRMFSFRAKASASTARTRYGI